MLLPQPWSVQARPPSSRSSLPSSSRQRSSTTSRTTSLQQQQQQQVIIYETEEYVNGEWKAPNSTTGRWSTVDGLKSSPPPPSMPPPPGHEWDGDWKIVITSDTRDDLGWEHVWAEHQPPTRRRTWLRSTTTATTTTTPPPAVSTTRTFRVRSSPVDFLKEDWNFKGFGWAFNKSLLFRDAFGVSFKVPITLNFGAWERRPGLPSITCSLDLYYPPTAAIFVSATLNLDYVKWALATFLTCCKHAIRTVVRAILGILLMVVVMPTKTPKTTTQLILEPPQYNVNISERIGMSLSWRISSSSWTSQRRKCEFRIAYLHSYLPTLSHWHSLWNIPQRQRRRRVLHNNNNKKKSSSSSSWLQEKSASLGISTSGPSPNPPCFSCNTQLSLSGFHYGKRKRKKVPYRET